RNLTDQLRGFVLDRYPTPVDPVRIVDDREGNHVQAVSGDPGRLEEDVLEVRVLFRRLEEFSLGRF
ncbi:MAG: hypothetical protein JRJ48_07740, partial [Deltaproteobacteria bacterium]|nr:hypothetical protein [Deltaproteobacteria bacterium]